MIGIQTCQQHDPRRSEITIQTEQLPDRGTWFPPEPQERQMHHVFLYRGEWYKGMATYVYLSDHGWVLTGNLIRQPWHTHFS